MGEITAMAPWFGSARMQAAGIGRQLRGCRWVGVPFGGGMCELLEIEARSLLVNDKHQHMINLCRVAAHKVLGLRLYRELRRRPFHVQELADAQERCRQREAAGIPAGEDLSWAIDYFICSWMGRHAKAGTRTEFSGGLSFRWNANGGDSAIHYYSAAGSLTAWRSRVLRRANFVCMDWRKFLPSCNDEEEIGIYCDPPFPDAGKVYKYTFTEQDHRDLSAALHAFRKARVVVRYYDHPLVDELYGDWTELSRVGRKASLAASEERLYINGPAYPEEAAA